jgi:hypothetical protein
VNPNRCHALTYLFYKLNKCQILRWELVGIDRNVLDPAAPTDVQLNNPPPSNGVTVIPNGILATSEKRATVQQTATASLASEQSSLRLFSAALFGGGVAATHAVTAADRDAALKAVDAELVKEGLLTKDGQVSEQAKRLFGWEREIALPTAGIIVKGCLDECNTCEPELERSIELDLQRQHLENELLKRQIELLDKAQEYRCCPEGDDDGPEPSP